MRFINSLQSHQHGPCDLIDLVDFFLSSQDLVRLLSPLNHLALRLKAVQVLRRMAADRARSKNITGVDPGLEPGLF